MKTDTIPASSATWLISSTTPAHVVGLVHRWQRASAVQAPVPVVEVGGAPVVVRARLDPTELDVAHALEAQHHRRVQDRDIDPVGVHVLEAQRRGPSRRPGLAVVELPVAHPLDVFVGEPRGSREPGRREALAVPDRILDAVLARLEVPDALAVRLRGEVAASRSVARGCARPSRCSCSRSSVIAIPPLVDGDTAGATVAG